MFCRISKFIFFLLPISNLEISKLNVYKLLKNIKYNILLIKKYKKIKYYCDIIQKNTIYGGPNNA